MRFLRVILLVVSAFGVVACTSSNNPPPVTGYDYGVRAFDIKPRMVDDIMERHLATINSVRGAQGLALLQYSPELNQAASLHAENIFIQKRAWHFGTDGSSPIQRIANAGFTGTLVGENLSETYEDDQVTLQAWLRDPNSRSIILAPEARFIGFAWYQEPNKKLWWVQVVAEDPFLGPIVN